LPAPSFLSEFIRDPGGAYALQNSRSGQVLATRLEPAFDSASRRRGLLGREGMEPDSAILIAPCSGVHTFFMRFVIDVVFAARDGRVVKTFDSLPAWRIALGWGAFVAIELPSGTIERSKTRRGDQLRLVSR
jgi:uncharacterized membrane protein (UPF0127 family)